MINLNQKLNLLKKKIDNGETITIAIFGLGSAGLVIRTTLGDAQVLAIRTRVLVAETMRELVSEPGKYFGEAFLEWMAKKRKEL